MRADRAKRDCTRWSRAAEGRHPGDTRLFAGCCGLACAHAQASAGRADALVRRARAPAPGAPRPHLFGQPPGSRVRRATAACSGHSVHARVAMQPRAILTTDAQRRCLSCCSCPSFPSPFSACSDMGGAQDAGRRGSRRPGRDSSRASGGGLATVGLMLWPGPHDELMITDFKAGTSAAISALLPGDGQPSAPGVPIVCVLGLGRAFSVLARILRNTTSCI